MFCSRIIAVAIGGDDSLDWDELRAIASSEKDLIRVGDYVDLGDFFASLFNFICYGEYTYTSVVS